MCKSHHNITRNKRYFYHPNGGKIWHMGPKQYIALCISIALEGSLQLCSKNSLCVKIMHTHMCSPFLVYTFEHGTSNIMLVYQVIILLANNLICWACMKWHLSSTRFWFHTLHIFIPGWRYHDSTSAFYLMSKRSVC